MTTNYSIVQGPYFHDLMAQPTVLRDTLAGLKTDSRLEELLQRLAKNETARVLLTGMGSSFHALHPLSLDLAAHGFTPLMIETSELDYYYDQLLDPHTLLIVVSQSGESVEIVRLMEINRRRSPVIAITNSPASSLALHSDAIVLTRAGQESTVSCKTYMTTLMALIWLGELLCRMDLTTILGELELAISLSESYLKNWNQYTQDLATLLHGVRDLFLVGRGSSLAAVGTGGLIVKESTHLHSEGMSSAAFRHGPMEMVDSTTFVLVFSGDPKTVELNRRLYHDILAASGRAGWVGPDATHDVFRLAAAPSRIRPLLEILPVQLITLSLAAMAGREAGRFERAQKITTTE
jgi:glucosamine--fructose-6-phosphate aminotransferase (isomerizing)